MSKATVEIERMVIRVENLFIESSSLEPTLLERIRMNLEKIPQMQNEEPEKIYRWWNDLGSDFIRLNQNYQDYMRELNSVKAEQMMKTQESHTAKTKRSRTSGSTGTVKTYRLREDQEQAGLLHGTFERDSAGKRGELESGRKILEEKQRENQKITEKLQDKERNLAEKSI